MSYTVLARKYRPQKFADVIGQEHVVRTLKNALEQQRIAHGYIFSGHRGIGKTTIARILAMALNCQSASHPVAEPCGECDSCREIRDGSVGAMDVIEIDAATNRGIEEVRGLIATASSEPARDRYRIFILDEAHQVTDAAFNALLKTLEEPPSWVVFMMATTQPEDIPQTIRSRCQHFNFHAVRFEEIVKHLREISVAEKLTVDDESLALLAEAGDGSMRDALSILDQAISCCGATISADALRGLIGDVSTEVIERVMRAVHAGQSEEVLRIVDKLMVEGQSATHFARQTVAFLRNALVAKVAGAESSILQISADDKKRVGAVAELFGEEDLTRFLQIMLRTYGDVSYKQEQRFHLELGLLKMVQAQRVLPLEQLLSSVNLLDAGSAPAVAPRHASPKASSSSSSAPTRNAAPARTLAPIERPANVPPLGGGSPFGAPHKPSPFEADTARKGRDSGANTPSPFVGSTMSSPFGAPPAISAVPPLRGQHTVAPFGASHHDISSKARPTVTPSAVSPLSPFDNGSSLALEAPPPPDDNDYAVTAEEHEQFAASAQNAVPATSPQFLDHHAAFDLAAVKQAVLEAMTKGASQMLLSAVEEGNWSAEADAVAIQVAMSESMIELSYPRAQEQLASQAASQAAGRALKVQLIAGGLPGEDEPRSVSVVGAESVKTRALEEPVVQRMMEKFGAEIRMVMDRSER